MNDQIKRAVLTAESRWHECSHDRNKMCLPCVKGMAADVARDALAGSNLVVCDKCGHPMFDFNQWIGGIRTCLTCSLEIQAIEAAMLACPGCLKINMPLIDGIGNGRNEYHPDTDELGDLFLCHSLGIRRRFGLGDGLLVDWIAEKVSE